MSNERAIHACALFGLTPDEARRTNNPRRAARALALRIDCALRPGEIALVTGPSGTGKSSLLAALGSRFRLRHGGCITVSPRSVTDRRGDLSVIDLFTGSPERALRTLAHAGLGEATIAAQHPSTLSDGQRWRLALALAMDRAQRRRRPLTLLIDEFGASLDTPTARAVASSLARWVRAHAQARAVCATTRDDLLAPLGPALRIHINPPGSASTTALVRRASSTPRRPRLHIARGTIADYDRLAHLHYRAGRPATHERILVARIGEETAGVLVVSRPTLNGAWRLLAWPRLFSGLPRRRAVATLNASIRSISRVIVDPRFRSQGVAAGLVRAYLRRPLTPATEAMAAMSVCSPFFAAAGMTEYRLGPTGRNARLADALAHAGLRPADLLRQRPPALPALVRRELRRWAADAGATRHLARAPLARLAKAAAIALCSPRIAYAHTQGGPP